MNLLERLYETLYTQRIHYGNTPEAEEEWPHRIMPYRYVVDVEQSPVIQDGIRLHVRDQSQLYLSEVPGGQERKEILDFDAIFVATGYHRDLHETLLKDARHLMPGGDLKDAKWAVQRDYRVNFADKKVSEDAGVWLQGCCETTHGVSLFPPPVGEATMAIWVHMLMTGAVERHAPLGACMQRRRNGALPLRERRQVGWCRHARAPAAAQVGAG